MSDILIQFHALKSELLPFVEGCVRDFRLHITGFRFFPFEAMETRADDLPRIFSDSSPWEEFAFTLGPPVLPAVSAGKFADANPDRLRLAIGRQTNHGLRQSSLSARTSNAEVLKIWQKIARRLKELTRTGVLAVNPASGASVKMATFRYTAGAKSLEDQGVPMIQVDGGPILKLG
jgi:hypothetical protein